MDYFLRYLSQYYEIVLFTSKPYAIAEQVVRKMDPFHMIQWPLFREATLYKDGGYVKVGNVFLGGTAPRLTAITGSVIPKSAPGKGSHARY